MKKKENTEKSIQEKNLKMEKENREKYWEKISYTKIIIKITKKSKKRQKQGKETNLGK